MTSGIVLIIVGVLIAVGSFVFALFNMGRQAKRTFDGNTGLTFSGFGGAIARHLGSMAGLLIGGLMAFVGFAMWFFGY